MQQDDELFVEFDVDLNLGVGEYTLTVAVHSDATHAVTNYDWWDKVIAFQIVPGIEPYFVGAAWLPVRLHVERRARAARAEYAWTFRRAAVPARPAIRREAEGASRVSSVCTRRRLAPASRCASLAVGDRENGHAHRSGGDHTAQPAPRRRVALHGEPNHSPGPPAVTPPIFAALHSMRSSRGAGSSQSSSSGHGFRLVEVTSVSNLLFSFLAPIVTRRRPALAVESFLGPVDVFHSVNAVLLPQRHGRQRLTVHDLTCLTLPQFHPWRRRALFRFGIRRAIRQADAIIQRSRRAAPRR